MGKCGGKESNVLLDQYWGWAYPGIWTGPGRENVEWEHQWLFDCGLSLPIQMAREAFYEPVRDRKNLVPENKCHFILLSLVTTGLFKIGPRDTTIGTCLTGQGAYGSSCWLPPVLFRSPSAYIPASSQLLFPTVNKQLGISAINICAFCQCHIGGRVSNWMTTTTPVEISPLTVGQGWAVEGSLGRRGFKCK